MVFMQMTEWNSQAYYLNACLFTCETEIFIAIAMGDNV